MAKKFRIVNKNIATLRHESKLSQYDLAHRLQITRDRLSAWEEYRSVPPVDYLIIIADYFKVTVDRLVRVDIAKL